MKEEGLLTKLSNSLMNYFSSSLILLFIRSLLGDKKENKPTKLFPSISSIEPLSSSSAVPCATDSTMNLLQIKSPENGMVIGWDLTDHNTAATNSLYSETPQVFDLPFFPSGAGDIMNYHKKNLIMRKQLQ